MRYFAIFFWFLPMGFLQAAPAALIYRDNGIGSEVTFNPLSHYLNLAFDTTQNPHYFTQSGFFRNHSVLWNRIKNPQDSIQRAGGLGKFVTNEIIGLRAIPNYFLHGFGGGYDYRWLAEWYEAKKIPFPYVCAFVTSYLANIGNEAVETTASQVDATDHIADLFIFDIISKILFINDDVVLFTRDTLQMRGWHFQPMFNLARLRIDNAGSNYIFRPAIFGDLIRPFVHVGLAVLGGVSWKCLEDHSVTLAAGIAFTDPLAIAGDPVIGLYWDRNDALLASMTLNGSSNLIARLNIYPHFIDTGSIQTGIYAAYSKTHETSFGVSIQMPAGISASF